MARFHRLTVTALRHTIRDAVVVTLQPDDPQAFAFTQGQHLTFRRDFDGTELRRNYSICTGPDDGMLQIGIKRVVGGAFSTWAISELKIGDRIDAMPPSGQFFSPLEPDKARHYLMFAGGSGITPILSNLRTVLAREPKSSVTLVYANRAVSTIMFREELEDLKDSHLHRLNLIHILGLDSQDIDLFTGRLSAEKCAQLFRHWIDLSTVDIAFICGPEPMMLTIRQALQDHGLPRDRIKTELFKSGQPGRLVRTSVQIDAVKTGRTCEATVTLDGRTRNFPIPMDGTRLLDAVNANSMDAPFACRAGVCSTCKARLLEGRVEMAANHALEDDQVRDGYILTCQATPLTDRITLTYDL